MKMKKGYVYIISGLSVIGVATILYFWRRGKGKSKVEDK